MILGNTDSLNYAKNDGTCDHSWLILLLGNTPLFSPRFYETSIFNQSTLCSDWLAVPLCYIWSAAASVLKKCHAPHHNHEFQHSACTT